LGGSRFRSRLSVIGGLRDRQGLQPVPLRKTDKQLYELAYGKSEVWSDGVNSHLADSPTQGYIFFEN